ncbi:uncharacterized protein LOC119163495 isoform X1 [Rhipicephalus microplus]|uniref:uncharacterized protein LOC119163495 isoform X1 n=1 Tax=Rhipicephalus microplus TaxID=6941 RepID=UPI003F6A85EC
MELSSTTSNQTVVELEANKTDEALLRNGGAGESALSDGDVSSLPGSQGVAKKSRRSVASLLVVFLDALVPARTLVELATEVLLAALAAYVVLSISGAFQVGSSPGMWRPAFRCDDPNLQSPFLAESVRTRDLAIFVATLPPAMLLVLEFRRSGAPLRDRFFWSGRMLRRYLVGLLLVTTATQLLKDAVAEKRPYFLDACKPVFRNQRNTTLLCQEVIRSPPSSPFRCDDPSLQAPQERDILPTAPYLLVVWASSHAVVLVNEMWRPGVSWTDATYWAARHIRRLFVGLVISGDITSIIKMAFNAKRPFFIDACQPAVRLPNGTEVLVCSGRPVAPGPRSGAWASTSHVELLSWLFISARSSWWSVCRGFCSTSTSRRTSCVVPCSEQSWLSYSSYGPTATPRQLHRDYELCPCGHQAPTSLC